ncbi:lipopolysaccharide-induced tumor necrosis factor-alpha factor homolog [Zophobas morio]|uniref:lipopolysaccharide-induced tumor necrosis factor-alpha factor homolog n=1 Tax=Zophobas morio TaxID=2755281 RepID=UPI003082EE51
MYQDNPPPYSKAGQHSGMGPPPTGMAPPPPGMKPEYSSSMPYNPPPADAQATHVFITSGPHVVLGPNPQHMICPSCHAQITTSVKTEPNTKTHLFALLLCLFQCWLCCCIPYCVDSCQSQNHYCPSCGAYLGTFEN